MSKKNLHLQFDYDYDFELVAIVSSYPVHRVCWHINQALGIGLAFKEEVKLEKHNRRQAAAFFNLYSYTDEMNRMQYYLVCNKSAGDILVPEMKEVDYFLQISGGNAAIEMGQVVKSLKEIAIIEAVLTADPAALRSKQNLVFE